MPIKILERPVHSHRDLLLPGERFERGALASPEAPYHFPAAGKYGLPSSSSSPKSTVGELSASFSCTCTCRWGLGQKPASPEEQSSCPAETLSPTATNADPAWMCTYSARSPSSCDTTTYGRDEGTGHEGSRVGRRAGTSGMSQGFPSLAEHRNATGSFLFNFPAIYSTVPQVESGLGQPTTRTCTAGKNTTLLKRSTTVVRIAKQSQELTKPPGREAAVPTTFGADCTENPPNSIQTDRARGCPRRCWTDGLPSPHPRRAPAPAYPAGTRSRGHAACLGRSA